MSLGQCPSPVWSVVPLMVFLEWGALEGGSHYPKRRVSASKRLLESPLLRTPSKNPSLNPSSPLNLTWRRFLGEFLLVSVPHKTKHENSSKNSGKFGANSELKFEKFGELSFCNCWDLTKTPLPTPSKNPSWNLLDNSLENLLRTLLRSVLLHNPLAGKQKLYTTTVETLHFFFFGV